MAELILVRHGQASAFDADYDKLSDLGHRQARVLGDHWVKDGFVPDAVVVGSLRRHRETLAGVQQAFTDAGLAFPDALEDADWNEYDAHTAIGALGPQLAERNPAFAKLMQTANEHRGGPEQNRFFQRAFEVFMAAWVAGDIEGDGVETFATFHGRVAKARQRVLARSGAGTIAVFTSGGPIGANVQLTLQAPASQFIALNSRVRNASLTHFLFSRQRVSLDRFNIIHHLDHEPELITFR